MKVNVLLTDISNKYMFFAALKYLWLTLKYVYSLKSTRNTLGNLHLAKTVITVPWCPIHKFKIVWYKKI